MELTDLINLKYANFSVDTLANTEKRMRLKRLSLHSINSAKSGCASVEITPETSLGDSPITTVNFELYTGNDYKVSVKENEEKIEIQIEGKGNHGYENLRNMFGFVEFALKELEKANTERMKEDQHD